MGIFNTTLTADTEFTASMQITANLTDIILNQERDFSNYNKERVAATIKNMKSVKERQQQDLLKDIIDTISGERSRLLVDHHASQITRLCFK